MRLKPSLLCLSALACALAANLLYAQSHQDTRQTPVPEQAAASPSPPPEIFCPTMKTGQLCSHGTADALKLAGAKRDQWIEAARRYNKAVDAATVRLLDDAKAVLSPEELQLVEMWFAKGLNPQINRILATR